ncbi:MAG: hypothetical protein SFT94_06520 [Pseudanabaenaceae cyanobacterium bins.68]|nr:hypothetical protein [Pseudanabaenaceae cyanobacterium bins.68]
MAMLTQTQLISAIEQLNYRVTVGDLATAQGLDLRIANRELVNLASQSAANLQVSETGEIAYVFAPDLRQRLFKRSLRLRLLALTQLAWKWLFWLFRLSFGILLIVAIAIVVIGIVLAVIAIQTQKDQEREERSEGRSINLGGFSPGGWIYWGDAWSVFTPNYYEQAATASTQSTELGFLEAVFSVLFGDGNPNRNLEQQRWQAIANLIRQHQGAVIAEQVAPYLDQVSTASEDYMLPVLVKFNGYPQVSEAGELAYNFPDLQQVATERPPQSDLGYLVEQPWQFSRATQGQVFQTIGLGLFYLVAALGLGGLLQEVEQISGVLTVIASLYGWLLGYAILFITIPGIRFLWLRGLNTKINQRNRDRQARLTVLQNQAPKLAFAAQLAIAQQVVDPTQLAYNTEVDYLEQSDPN